MQHKSQHTQVRSGIPIGIASQWELSGIGHSQMVNLISTCLKIRKTALHSKKAVFCYDPEKTTVISLNEPNVSTSKESKASHAEPKEHVGDLF